MPCKGLQETLQTRHSPAGIWCENDVGSTSMRRHHVASTLIRRHFCPKCPLGDIRRPSYCQQTKHLMEFNASFAILKKGTKSCINVFKCERRTKVPMEKEPQQNDHLFGKELFIRLTVRVFLMCVLSLLVLRVGCGL